MEHHGPSRFLCCNRGALPVSALLGARAHNATPDIRFTAEKMQDRETPLEVLVLFIQIYVNQSCALTKFSQPDHDTGPHPFQNISRSETYDWVCNWELHGHMLLARCRAPIVPMISRRIFQNS